MHRVSATCSGGLMRRSLAALAVGLIALSACAVTSTQRRQEALMFGVRDMNDGLRWGRYVEISKYLPEQEGKLLVERAADLGDDFRVADNELKSVEILKPGEEARATMQFEWYTDRGSILKKSTVEQLWRFDDGRWLVVEQRRVRGDRFPLVPEKLKRDAGATDGPAAGPGSPGQ